MNIFWEGKKKRVRKERKCKEAVMEKWLAEWEHVQMSPRAL
jgi:hypothetical protein